MDVMPKSAWEPVTPRGVAGFARASLGRLWLVQFLVALVVAATTGWLLYDAFFPTVTAALQKLPDTGEIRGAKLNWPGEPKQSLAEGRFLSFNVDLEHTGAMRSPAHVQVEFGREFVRVFGLLGYVDVKYPPGWVIAFNRPELVPKWGAWQPPLLALTVAGVVAYLLIGWTVLATLYALPVWLFGFYVNRDLSLGASWKLAGASLMPAALLMALGLVLYDMALMDLVGLGFIAGAHVVVGWIYPGVSLVFLPRHPEVVEKKNPFAPTPT